MPQLRKLTLALAEASSAVTETQDRVSQLQRALECKEQERCLNQERLDSTW